MEEIEPFKVTGAKADPTSDFSDDIMGKSAEELFMEDMEKKKEDLQNETEEPEGLLQSFNYYHIVEKIFLSLLTSTHNSLSNLMEIGYC